MNNIRVSIDLTKVDGARTIRAAAPSGKQEYYVAIPVSSLFLPKDSHSAHLTCTMIPCPNALYGDFMLKKYINGTTYANMSQEERNAVPIIGKGTYIVPKMEKSQAQAYTHIDVESANLDDIREQQEQTSDPTVDKAMVSAPSSTAPFPAESGKSEAEKVFLIDGSGQWWECQSYPEATAYGDAHDPENCVIKVMRGDEVTAQYKYDLFYQQWVKTAID